MHIYVCITFQHLTSSDASSQQITFHENTHTFPDLYIVISFILAIGFSDKLAIP